MIDTRFAGAPPRRLQKVLPDVNPDDASRPELRQLHCRSAFAATEIDHGLSGEAPQKLAAQALARLRRMGVAFPLCRTGGKELLQQRDLSVSPHPQTARYGWTLRFSAPVRTRPP